MKLYKLFRKTPFFLSATYWMDKNDRPVKSSEQARPAVMIPLLLAQYGSMADKVKSLKVAFPQIVTIAKEMHKSAKEVGHNPGKGRTHISDAELAELENYARSLGISDIGYTQVNPDFIFKDFKILHDQVIMFSMEMRRDQMHENFSKEATNEIFRTYSGLGVAVNKIAAFLRERGFDCQASPAMGGDIMTTPVAQDACMGVVGKNGLLITPDFGPSLRLAAVFVSIENLPIKQPEDNPHLWIRDFCETCNHCVRSCPGNAIYETTKTLEDGYPQFIEREKCAPFFSKNCSRCVSACPFFHGNYDKVKKRYVQQLEEDESSGKEAA